jgi:glycosyl transferase family 87
MMTTDTPLAQRLGRISTFVILCLLFIVILTINVLPFFDGKSDLMDFGSFYAAGLKLQSGENPYDPNSEYIFDISFARVGAGGKMINLNPPISAMIFQFISKFEPHQAMTAWQILSAVLYLSVVWILITAYGSHARPGIVIWTLTLAGLWHTLVLGQIYILLLFFTALGWVFLQREKYILAGVAIGLLIAIKPNFIIWPLFLLVSGYSLTCAISIISSLIVSLIPIAFWGTKIYTQWLEASALRPETLRMPGNSSLVGLTARFHSVGLGIAISIILVLALLALSRLKSPNHMERPEYISALGILASLLASPISWTGYTILLLPIYFGLKKWTWPVIASAVILSIPFAIVLQLFQNSFINFVILGWLYGWGILLLLGDVVRNTMMTKSIQTS